MRRLLLSMAAVLPLLACATTSTTAPPPAGPRVHASLYHPLAVGNQWTYVGKMMGQAVEKTITIKGMQDGYFADDANGQLKVDAEGLRDDKRYLLREPLERGRTWSSIVSVSSTERYEIADMGFTTSTPAGSFNDCLLVRGTNRIDADKALRTEWTFAPNVGIVRINITAVANGREIPQGLLELKSMHLVK